MSKILVNNITPVTGERVTMLKHEDSGSVTFVLSGSAIFGTASAQTIVANAAVSSSLVPSHDCEFNLGSTTKRWGLYGCTLTANTLTSYASTDLSVNSNGHIFMNPVATKNVAVGKSTTPLSPAGVARFVEIADAESAGISLNDTAASHWDIYSASGRLHFHVNNAAGNNGGHRMTVLHDGQVGIGTLAPAALLHVAGAAKIDSNLTVDGNLTVNGTSTIIESTTLTVDDKNIELGTVASPTDATADGGGITLKGASDYKIEWKNATDKWTFNQGIHVDVGNLVVDANVGVGEATPTSTAGVARFIEVSDASSAGIVMDDTGGTEFAIYSADNYLNFVSEANSRAKLSDDGKFGLGVDPQRLLHVGGDAEVDGDLYCNDDVKLNSDSAVLNFGADNDITLTHTADTSLTLGGAGSTTGLVINNTATDGDPFVSFALGGTQTFTMGVDDGDGDIFKIGTTAIGTNTRLAIDSSGKVGIGETTPLGQLHVKTGDSGTSTLDAKGDDLVVESNGNAGISIMAGSIHVAGIYFPDESDPDIGYIKYDHGTNGMAIRTNGTDAILIDNAQKVTITGDLEVNGGFSFNNDATTTLRIDPTAEAATGRDFIVEAGSTTTTGTGNVDGGDLVLRSGVARDAGSSVTTFAVSATTDADAIAEKMRIHTNGFVGIAQANPTKELHVGGDVLVGDDLFLQSDSSVIHFGAGDDVSLTHTNDVGLHLNAGMRLGFRDQGGEYIHSVSDGILGIAAETEIDLTATTIDINGACDISGAFTLNGTTIAETIADTVGAMVSSNTETGIAVTYEDADNTLDFVLGTAQTTISSIYNAALVIGRGASDARIDFGTDDQITFEIDNNDKLHLKAAVLEPESNGSYDLGATAKRFQNIFCQDLHTNDLHLSNDRGDWTIIEEEDYLSIRNNKNGKMFKFVMQEISEE